MPIVLLLRKDTPEYREPLEKGGLEPIFIPSDNAEALLEYGVDADAVIFAATRFTSEVFDRLPRLKIISRTGIGIDTVDLAAASAHRVTVCNSSSYGTRDVAQHTVALLLSLIHSVPLYNKAVKEKNDWSLSGIPSASRLSDKVLGIVGFGRISRHVCEMMKGFGTRILVHDPFVDKSVAEALGVSAVDLDTLLRESDILSVNAPLTPSTRHMIGKDAISKMKYGAMLVNTSRGPLVDEEALIEALSLGKLSGAALDVFENEPFSPDSKLRTLPNVVLTPHVAWRSNEAMRDLAAEATGNVVDFFAGRALRNKLNEF